MSESPWRPDPGESVHYVPFKDCPSELYENGVVKAVSDEEHVFVVYHCAGEWHRYQEFTGARTNINDLRPGWWNHES